MGFWWHANDPEHDGSSEFFPLPRTMPPGLRAILNRARQMYSSRARGWRTLMVSRACRIRGPRRHDCPVIYWTRLWNSCPSDIEKRTGLKPSRFFLHEISRVNLVRHRAMLGSSSVSRQMVGETLFSAESVQSCSIISRPKRARLPQLAALLVLGTRRGP